MGAKYGRGGEVVVRRAEICLLPRTWRLSDCRTAQPEWRRSRASCSRVLRFCLTAELLVEGLLIGWFVAQLQIAGQIGRALSSWISTMPES